MKQLIIEVYVVGSNIPDQHVIEEDFIGQIAQEPKSKRYYVPADYSSPETELLNFDDRWLEITNPNTSEYFRYNLEHVYRWNAKIVFVDPAEEAVDSVEIDDQPITH